MGHAAGLRTDGHSQEALAEQVGLAALLSIYTWPLVFWYVWIYLEMSPSHTWRYVYSKLENPQRAPWQPQAWSLVS